VSAFQDVRIVDFSQGVAGPMASMLLGDFEADVVKVEPPAGVRLGSHPGYQAWNRNKTVVTLDLETPGGLAVARELIANADVALFDFSSDVLERLELDPARLLAAHPDLIVVWMPPYGISGRWTGLEPHHSLLTALSGDALRQGAVGDAPVHMVIPYLWYGQAVIGAAAIGAALYERSQSGLGQVVTVSGLHGSAVMSLQMRVVQEPQLPRTDPQGAAPNYRLYQCADGHWLFLGTLFAGFFDVAMRVLGLTLSFDDLVEDLQGSRDAIAAVVRSRSREAWLAALQGAGVPCAPVETREAWFASKAVAQSGLKVTLDHPELGPITFPGAPVKLSQSPGSVRALPRRSAGPHWRARALQRAGRRGGGGRGPLEGVRVLDLGAVVAGAHAGGILANFGADVIKVEPITGDPFRSDGALFLAYNRGKRGLGMDLKMAEGVALFHDLVRGSDVVLDNYRHGVRSKLGIDYAALSAVNPRIVSCSISGYGTTGDRATLPGFDPLLQAESGMMAAQGGDGAPVFHTVPINDAGTAAMAAFGIIAALNARERTGVGQEVLTSLLAQSLMFQLGELATFEARAPNRSGGRDCLGVLALDRFYACMDGWIALVCETPREASALAGVLGLSLEPGDAAAALLEPPDGALAARIAAAFADRPRDQVLEAMLGAGVCAAPARNGDDVVADAFQVNAPFEAWRHPRIGAVFSARAYADFSRTPGGFRHPTPDLWEHTQAVLDELGLAPDQIDRLVASGAVF
jgi:crotonobetainyl-CoA:carnitine CoA-transferase CaiB-like acyl-CoA transferase